MAKKNLIGDEEESYDLLDSPDEDLNELPSHSKEKKTHQPSVTTNLNTPSKPALTMAHAVTVSSPPPPPPPKKTSAIKSSRPRIAMAEDTPAYRVLQKYGLLNTSYRKDDFDDIFQENDLFPNSSHSDNLKKRLRWGVHWTPGCGFFVYNIFNTEITIPPRHICRFIDNDNNYLFAKPGVHNIRDPFLKKVGFPVNIIPLDGNTGNVFEHGNRTVVTIPQGKLGYATDRGNPVLLPPGLHAWMSETVRYERTYDLEDHVIRIGPYTLLTVDEGYAAITQDNGKQVIVQGGDTHLLTHQKWRFEKFITLKIQTDELEQIRAASADNVIMSVNSTVVWRIKDVRIAATNAAETMAGTGRGEVSADISKLRRDVLKQAIASLAGFIGSVNYSDSFHIAAAAQRKIETATAVCVDESGVAMTEPQPSHKSAENPMFDMEGMSDTVLHANTITNKFGVEIVSINIISANPVDANLTASLATGAVASAEALQAETQARGMAKAVRIEADAAAMTRAITAQSEADATLVKARAEGQAEVLRAEGDKSACVLRAEGSLEAARLLEGSDVAVALERMRVSVDAIGQSDKFFFGQEPEYMANVVMKGLGCGSKI